MLFRTINTFLFLCVITLMSCGGGGNVQTGEEQDAAEASAGASTYVIRCRTKLCYLCW